MKSTIFILLFFLISILAQTCQPLYWESDPAYTITINQIENYALSEIINLPNIQNTSGNPIKTHYYLKNIQTTILSDSSNKQVSINTNIVSVSNVIFQFNFSFDTIVNGSKNYTGITQANLKNVNASYKKDLIINNGSPTFILTSAVIQFNNPIQILNSIPNITDTQIQQTIKALLSQQVSEQLKQQIELSFDIFLKSQFKNQRIQNTFGSMTYNYQFQDYKTLINTEISELILNNGKMVGYNGSIVDFQAGCSHFKPNQPIKATFFSKQFINNIWNNYLQDPNIQALIVDGTNAKSDLFQFYLIDLEDIIPNAINDYPNYFSNLNSKCRLDPNIVSIKIDKISNGIIAQVRWNCQLLHSDTQSLLLQFNPQIQCLASINQNAQSLSLSLKSLKLINLNWIPLDMYPLVNEPLATQYLLSLLNTFLNTQVLGTNFKQPFRKNPKFTFDSQYLLISDISQGQQSLD